MTVKELAQCCARQRWEHTRVLMTLQHKLCNTGMRVPELNATVLGTTEHPVAMRG